MKKTKILTALLLSVLMACTFVFTACPEPEEEVVYQTPDVNDAYVMPEFSNLWDEYGKDIELEDVLIEDGTGFAYVMIDGVKTILGMDFLSMAMIYKSKTADEYDKWWQYYMTRCNYLVPDIALYCNTYYDIYNAQKITIPEGEETNPFWDVADALVNWSSTSNIIIGDSTDLSGKFRFSAFGVTSPLGSDLNVSSLINGLSTISKGSDGVYFENMDVLAAPIIWTDNDDGSLTMTMEIKSDLKLSGGTAITADHYIASLLSMSTVVSEEAGGTGKAGYGIVGWEAFNAYDGTNEGATVKVEGVDYTATKYFEGIEKLSDTKFRVTIGADLAAGYYRIVNGAFSPYDIPMLLGTATVGYEADKGCFINGGNFYATTGTGSEKKFTFAETLKTNVVTYDRFEYSGPYTVSNWDSGSKEATLTKNPNYPTALQPSIPTVIYKGVVNETMLQSLENGAVDFLSTLTGADIIDDAIALTNKAGIAGKFKTISYNRAGYGQFSMRSDFSPTMFLEVRQAINYSLDADEFREAFCGAYGVTVYGPYYTAFASYINAVENGMELNTYEYNLATAKQLLIDGGWTYNVKGKAFVEGTDTVRYKKLEGMSLTANNITYQSIDGAYKTVKIDGVYYMPLAINWCCSENNPVSELLKLYWYGNTTMQQTLGMVIQFSQVAQMALFGEWYQYAPYGWNGVAMYSVFNKGMSFSSTIYDFSWNWRIDDLWFENNSYFYMKDIADYVWLS